MWDFLKYTDQEAMDAVDHFGVVSGLSHLIWGHSVPDIVGGLAFISLSVAVFRATRDQRAIRHSWLFRVFVGLVLICGFSRVLAIYTLWVENDTIEVARKWAWNLAMVGIAMLFWPLIQKMIGQIDRTVSHLQSELEISNKEREIAERALRQSQKMEAIGRLTGGISHDFNNLLQGISGHLEMIQLHPESPNVREWADGGLRGVEKGAGLVKQLLAFSRVKPQEVQEVRLGLLVRNLCPLLKSYIGSIYITVEDSSRGFALVDPVQLEMVILNLVLNACDAMPNGGSINIVVHEVDVECSLVPTGRYLEIKVIDTGTGIADEHRDRVFDPFFTTKDQGKGTGLGLSMVYGVARQMNGYAHIPETGPNGTTVVVGFPLIEDTGSQMPSAQKEFFLPEYGDKRTVLVVDDNPAVRMSVEAHLISLGYEVETAEDGVQALTLLKEHPKPDLVLLDYVMPYITGADVVKAIKQMHPGICFGIMTGFADENAIADYPVLRKPFRTNELAEFVERTIGNRNCDTSYAI